MGSHPSTPPKPHTGCTRCTSPKAEGLVRSWVRPGVNRDCRQETPGGPPMNRSSGRDPRGVGSKGEELSRSTEVDIIVFAEESASCLRSRGSPPWVLLPSITRHPRVGSSRPAWTSRPELLHRPLPGKRAQRRPGHLPLPSRHGVLLPVRSARTPWTSVVCLRSLHTLGLVGGSGSGTRAPPCDPLFWLGPVSRRSFGTFTAPDSHVESDPDGPT